MLAGEGQPLVGLLMTLLLVVVFGPSEAPALAGLLVAWMLLLAVLRV